MRIILDFFKGFPIQKAVGAVVLILFCLLIVKILLSVFDQFLKHLKIDALICKFLRIIVKAFLLFTAVIIVLSRIGISVSSFIAALSVIGVALSLSIQGFLSNVFGGIQIISNHPFKIGDYVEAGGEAGSVREIGLFYTKLDTPDKKLIQIPNSKIANESIINYSHAPKRRVDFSVCVSYNDDTQKVRSVLLELLSQHPLILSENELMPCVHVKEFKEHSICYTARGWCENENYWTVYFDIMNAIQPTFEKNGISFIYPHINIHMAKKETDL